MHTLYSVSAAVLLLLSAAVPGHAAVPVSISGYDIANARTSGFGGWAHLYTGTITPISGTLANYSGGTGTMANGANESLYTSIQLFETADHSAITVYLDGMHPVQSIEILGGGDPFDAMAGEIEAMDITIGTTTQRLAGQPFGAPNLFGTPRNDRFVLAGTSLAGLATDRIVLSNVSEHDCCGQFSIAEIRVYVEPVTCDVSVGAPWLLKQSAQPWGPQLYNHLDPAGFLGYASTIEEWGCYLTDLAMVIQSCGVSTGTDGKEVTPDALNDWLRSKPDGYLGVVANPALIGEYTGQQVQFHGAGSGDPASIAADLSAGLIPLASVADEAHRVVALDSCAEGPTGTFLIADPARAVTTLSGYDNIVSRTDLFYCANGAAVPFLQIAAMSPVELLMTDSSGRKTGKNPGTPGTVAEIPGSSYAPIGWAAASSTPRVYFDPVKNLYTRYPADGQYTLTASGTALGSYELSIRSASDASLTTVVGLASANSTATYRLNYSDGQVSVALVASFASTLADIDSALRLGLIDSEGVATSLSQKIQAAGITTGPARANVLNAFKRELNAQAGIHITGVAVQVLLNDADSLLAQN